MASSKDFSLDIPSQVSDSEVIYYIQSKDLGSKHLGQLKSISASPDKIISEWFDVSEKTLQSYRKKGVKLSSHFKEKLVLLISLYNQGAKVLGSNEAFRDWLEKPNFHFDNQAPITFFNTISGIRYIQDRLVGMAYGDNA